MAGDALGPLMLALKLALYAATLLSAGLALQAALGVIERDGRRPWLGLAVGTGACALFLGALKLMLVNAQLAGGLAHAFDAESFAWTWQGLGASLLALAAGASAALLAWALNRPLLGLLAALGFSASFALSGHAQALPAPGLAPWAVGIHVMIASFWIAAPLCLWPRSALNHETLEKRLQRFSRIAIVAVPLLFVAGVWLAWRLAGGFVPLVASEYGNLLLIKLAVAVVALGLGAFNKQVVTAMLSRAPARGRVWLTRTLAGETLAFVLALLLVGWATTMTGPPEP